MLPLQNKRHELVAQNLAIGLPKGEAYTRGGYRAKDPSNACCNLLRRFPEIEQRVKSIQDDILTEEKSRYTYTKETVVKELLENVRECKQIPVVSGKTGEVVGYRRDGGAINRALQLLGTEVGMFVHRSETKHGKLDPFEDATDDTLIQYLETSLDRLGLEVDVGLLRSALGIGGESPPRNGRGSKGVDASSTPLLPASSEAAGVSPDGPEGEVQAPDGWESGWEISSGFGRNGDARDGDLSVGLEGEEVSEADPKLGRGGDDPYHS